MGILVGIFAAAFLQDLSYTVKTVLVSRGHRKLAVAADVTAMLTSSLYLMLTASVTMRSGLSFATVEAFAAIAIGGACGTIGGMSAVEFLEWRFARIRPISEAIMDGRQDGRVWLSFWLSLRRTLAGMDGNRTHPGRLNSAPQTVLKTASLKSALVHERALEFGRSVQESLIVRLRPQSSAGLAVSLAVEELRSVIQPRLEPPDPSVAWG